MITLSRTSFPPQMALFAALMLLSLSAAGAAFAQNNIPVSKHNAQASTTPASYGPVKKGDSLASIARQWLPADLPLRQRLVAIRKKNRDRHPFNTIHALPVGISLLLPTRAEILQVSEQEIAQLFGQASSLASQYAHSAPTPTTTAPNKHSQPKLAAANTTSHASALSTTLPPLPAQRVTANTASHSSARHPTLPPLAVQQVETPQNPVQQIDLQAEPLGEILQEEQEIEFLSDQLAETGERLQRLEQQSLHTTLPSSPLNGLNSLPVASSTLPDLAWSPSPLMEQHTPTWDNLSSTTDDWYSQKGLIATLLSLLAIFFLLKNRRYLSWAAATSPQSTATPIPQPLIPLSAAPSPAQQSSSSLGETRHNAAAYPSCRKQEDAMSMAWSKEEEDSLFNNMLKNSTAIRVPA
ncbi:type IV pilus assembly protein FimV [Candidatus Magnetaquicoccus inordinatus]|uniref:type IV pilus assembly protein FimV n=1 Tax=Candidatus Magnetaquicoccus inordinatus TaxID=2496818 RepID=UPI00102B8A8D|nr:hypothetical protein [Candidatus Magnetaquicoccus inordinatus]